MMVPNNLTVDDLTANQLNNQDLSDQVFASDTTLNTQDDDNGGTSVADVIDTAIGALPGLILLGRTPQNKLPSVGAVQNAKGQTAVVSGVAVKKPINWTIIIVVVAVTAVIIAVITRK